MINISKKVMGIISFASACTIATATTLSTIALTNDNEVITSDGETYPLNRNRNYINYKISENIKTNPNINSIVSVINNGNSYLYVINEQVFLQNFQSIVRETLANISKFSNNKNSYIIECSYLIVSSHEIKIDLVWYLSSDRTKYFDQFVINLIGY